MRIYTYDATGRLVMASTLNESDRNPMYAFAMEKRLALRAKQADGEVIDSQLLTAYENEPEYLLPAHATMTAPPDVPEGHYARWMGASWVIEAEPEPEPVEAAPAQVQEAADAAVHTPAPVDPAQEKLQAAEAHVEEFMQAMARGARYKSLEDVITYADEPAVPAYQEEGKKFRAWRSLMWAWFYSAEIQAKVQDGSFASVSLNTEPPLLNPPTASDSAAPSTPQ